MAAELASRSRKPETGRPIYEPRQDQPDNSDALAELSPDDGSAVQAGEPAGSGIGSDSCLRRSAQSLRAPDVVESTC